jgi:hypothetical protein
MKLHDRLLEAGYKRPRGGSKIATVLRDEPVGTSPEFERIRALPRRRLIVGKGKVSVVRLKDGKPDAEELAPKDYPDATPYFARAGARLKLWPLQNAALHEISLANGGFLSISVGGGKTLVSLLAADALQSRRMVLLVKPQLRQQLLLRDVPFYSQHFRIPIDRIHVVSYNDLSSPRRRDILDKIRPDLIVADEAHSLRIRSSSRTRRFIRYMRENPGTRFVALSGTMSKRSILDFAHLIEFALRKNSPLPSHFRVLETWAEALDVSDDPKDPGVLLELCQSGETVREGFRRRMVETQGVVASEEGSLGTTLIIQPRAIALPDVVREKLFHSKTGLYATWRIGEEELADGMALNRVARQIVSGFHYEWKWKDGQRDVEWIMARRAWHKAVRDYLQHSSRRVMDSPFLLARAAQEGRWECDAWAPWAAVKSRSEPETVATWLSPFMVRDAVIWARERAKAKENGIIFYEHTALGVAIAQVGELPLFGAGADATTADVRKTPVIVCSIKAQGEGKNLQAWNRMLVTAPPANGLSWEQMIGRVHRPGQQADEVVVEPYLHCDEFNSAFESAIKDAQYIEQTQGGKQKLLFANFVPLGEERAAA